MTRPELYHFYGILELAMQRILHTLDNSFGCTGTAPPISARFRRRLERERDSLGLRISTILEAIEDAQASDEEALDDDEAWDFTSRTPVDYRGITLLTEARP